MTACTALANRCQDARCSLSALRPAVVSAYTRRLRPPTVDHVLATSPTSSRRCRAGYTVPVGRSKVPPLPARNASITA